MVVGPGLAYLRDVHPELSVKELKDRLRIGEVYFAAPDIDFNSFIERYLKFKDIISLTTMLRELIELFDQGVKSCSGLLRKYRV
ncbi:MAG: hypothetical protein GY702_16445 [Desulfobulbaceae bacterium]|nr:hypothetical protein [Desulfobulbaceae bacterium]